MSSVWDQCKLTLQGIWITPGLSRKPTMAGGLNMLTIQPPVNCQAHVLNGLLQPILLKSLLHELSLVSSLIILSSLHGRSTQLNLKEREKKKNQNCVGENYMKWDMIEILKEFIRKYRIEKILGKTNMLLWKVTKL